MVAKDRTKTTGSPKVEVGEIDTSAPFHSVKDAVNLFGDGAFSGEKLAIKNTQFFLGGEGALRRWHEREQKKAGEAASRILDETQTTSVSSPRNYRSEKENVLETSLESHLMKNRRQRK
ncbi:hypothetical protein K7X08_015083 [Anisodus acutangulus]|uniref:Uncharacterized protein n=1 Tax=Anisodus acutangulus TaxID=402998 RepID=A0A9Q1L5G0_9SOLA|nr:hypothetical protein K7X08_015083 [Anisodus acutangulus]